VVGIDGMALGFQTDEATDLIGRVNR